MGCALAARLVALIKRVKREHEPDVLFIEPSEMVVTSEMRQVIAMARRDIDFDPGPLITLIDGPNFDLLWDERKRLILGQITDADVVAVSRTDRISNGQMEAIHSALRPYSRRLYGINTREDAGMKPVWDAICRAMQHTPGSETFAG